MRLGIIGKPQSGKTTVFNAAAGQEVAVGDFSKAVHRAQIKVPDSRVDKLAEIVNPRKITYAEIELFDAPGLSGQGKDSGSVEISADLRGADALIMVVDAFSADARPKADMQNLIDEMILLDASHIESLLDKKTRKRQLSGDKSEERLIEILQRCQQALEQETPIIEIGLADEEHKLIRGFTFLTEKPLLVAVNIGEDLIPRADEIAASYADIVSPGKREVAVLCGKIEMELVGLDDADRAAFLNDLGITAPAMDVVIQKSYALLGLISFLTQGEKEVRAWTIPRGFSAQRAGSAIHSDIERGFIRAEVITYDDFVELQTPAAIKAAGKMRLEGKDYIVADGDVILFRFNV
ncbi:YchF family ATPase [bacterium]|nr:YchF family ATPase [bacterium]